MTSVEIQQLELSPLASKVIVITGGSSGIGLAAAELFISHGAKVVVGDVNPCPFSSDALTYQKVNVTDWHSQVALFKKAIEVHGRIDHVFANAGIGGGETYCMDKFDEKGELLPPDTKCLDVNLTGVLYTCKLGIHHMKKQDEVGSIVITGSAASFSPMIVTDYGTSKHAVLGLMRGLNQNLDETRIRVNCVTPLWTATGLVPPSLQERLGIEPQNPEVVARSAGWLMADESRRGMTMYSVRGKYKEMDAALLGAALGSMELGPKDGIANGDNALKKLLEEINPKAEDVVPKSG